MKKQKMKKLSRVGKKSKEKNSPSLTFSFSTPTCKNNNNDNNKTTGDSYPRGARIVLWLLLEAALVGADIQETIGSAIAIALLSGGRVPLWGGCLLITAAAFVVLLLERCGARHLEAVFGGLIAMQGVSAGVNYIQARVPQRDVLKGLFVPRMPAAAVPFAVGALGALVMPHNIYFASALASTSRPDVVPKGRTAAVAPAPAAVSSPSASATSISGRVFVSESRCGPL